MPNTVNTAYAYLIAWTDTFMQHYAPGVADMVKRHGRTTRIMPTQRRALNGNNIEYEFQAYPNRSTSATFDLMNPMPDPGPGSYGRFNVRFDHTDPDVNDFLMLQIGFRTTFWDMQKKADSNFKDTPNFIERDVRQGIDDVKETMSRMLHAPSDGAVGTVATDGKKDADSDSFARAGSYTIGSATCLLKLEATAIAKIGMGAHLDVRTSDGVLRANHVFVEYVHPIEQYVAVRVTDDSVDESDAPVTNCDTFAATDKLYITGQYNVVPKGSLNNLFDPSQEYYGKDRLNDEGYRALIPLRYDAAQNGNPVAISGELLRSVGEMAGWRSGDYNAADQRRLVVCPADQYRAISRFHKDEGIIFTPAMESDLGRQWNRATGFDGLVWHDPNMGSVMWTVDDFAQYGQIDFLDMNEWEMLVPYGSAGDFSFIPGSIAGIWVRNTENDGSGRPSKVFSAEGIQTFAFVCKKPLNQIRLYGLASPA